MQVRLLKLPKLVLYQVRSSEGIYSHLTPSQLVCTFAALMQPNSEIIVTD